MALLKRKIEKEKAFTPLEKTTNFNGGHLPVKTDGCLKPLSGQTIRERNSLTGFTLIEVLVSIAIFSLVLGSATSILISAIRIQRKTLAMRTLLDNTSYNLEYMSRALRMAKKDDIDGINCLLGNKVNYEITPRNGIKFRNYKNECQEFFLENNRLKEEKPGLGILNFLTPENIQIVSFRINQSGWNETDNLQPKVTLTITAEVQGQRLIIQTTTSQRDLDFQY